MYVCCDAIFRMALAIFPRPEAIQIKCVKSEFDSRQQAHDQVFAHYYVGFVFCFVLLISVIDY